MDQRGELLPGAVTPNPGLQALCLMQNSTCRWCPGAHSHSWSWVLLHSRRTSCLSLQTDVQNWQLSPQCQCSEKVRSGQGTQAVGVSAVQWVRTAVPGGHWSQRRSSEVNVSGSRYLWGGISWKAQENETAKSWRKRGARSGSNGERGERSRRDKKRMGEEKER
ncbi:hypothetical protein DPEC_G00050860 [Dallia pectoralis]|uniref:Uncharacterized protein n=1 Tax=Dallia pectoralis TaxID=75939 RepID=A0ACC2HBZ8_DALPE|nr:hypothetical protein DPEC_G00050860 [Dallia pectoralis]